MVLEAGEVMLWATVFGLLIGVIWSLKYIVIIDRRIERLEGHLDKILHKLEIRLATVSDEISGLYAGKMNIEGRAKKLDSLISSLEKSL